MGMIRLVTNRDEDGYGEPPYAYLTEPKNDEPAALPFELWLFDEDYREPRCPHIETSAGMIEFKNWEMA